jgi:neutral trehalase
LLWNDEAGFFFDYDPERAKQTGIFAVSGFLPLLCGACTTRQTDRLAAKLDDPDTFGTKVKIASAVTPGHPSGHDMWRGPVWINMNWLVAHGFERSGNASVAAQLHAATMQEIERWYRTAGYISEFYDEQGITNPELLPRKGTFDPTSPMHQSIHDYGWTATLYTDLVFKFANENTTEVAD